ncbi:MAG: hypothetical protein WBJ81_04620 [Rickettsiales bacterium]
MSDSKQLIIDAILQERSLRHYDDNKQYYDNDIYYAYMNLPKFTSETHNTIKPVIPRIMHYVWFTNESNPKQIPEAFLSNLNLEINKLNNYNLNSSEPWKVKFWVNCQDCIAPSLERISEMEYPIEVMKWQAEHFVDDRFYLKETVTRLINEKNGMGAAYDIGRYIIAEKYGGFLPDLNYNTGNSTEIVVQRGYQSLTSHENYYFGFKPQHKFLKFLNEDISNLFKVIEKYNMSSEFSTLDATIVADYFSYAPFKDAAEQFLGKEDLHIKPQCFICNDVQKLELFYGFIDINEINECSLIPLYICYVVDYQHAINFLECYLIIKDSLIDFGYDDKTSGFHNSWSD